jgi:nitroreductase
VERLAVAAQSPSDTPDSQVLAKLLSGRYSCRGFRPDPVPAETIARMFELAQLSASWCNVQPWQIVVTRPPATEAFRRALLDHLKSNGADQSDLPYPGGYYGKYLERRRECGWQLYESVGIARGDRAASTKQGFDNFRLFGAPHVLIMTTEKELGVYGVLDCGVYLGSLMLAAQSLGIATIAQAALARCSPFLHTYFDIPDTRQVVCGMSFGYADESHKANGFRTRRADLSEAITVVE